VRFVTIMVMDCTSEGQLGYKKWVVTYPLAPTLMQYSRYLLENSRQIVDLCHPLIALYRSAYCIG
jgi:hypothetical protein